MKNLRQSIIIGIICGLIVYVAMFMFSDLTKVDWARIKWYFIAIAIVFTLINYLVRMWRFEYYITKLKINLNKKLRRLIFFSGLTMSITPGKIGELIKSYLIKEANGTEISKTVPIVFAERVGDLIGMSILGAITAYAFIQNIYLLISVIAILIGLVILLRIKPLFLFILKIFEKIPFLKRSVVHLENMYSSFIELFTLKTFLITIGLSMISWVFEGIGLWAIVKAFGIDIPMAAAIFIFSFGTIAGAVSMLPGGLGVAEGSMYFLLLQAGVIAGIATMSTILIRFATLWFGVIVGIIALWLFEKEMSIS